jgi:hypothetical protein
MGAVLGMDGLLISLLRHVGSLRFRLSLHMYCNLLINHLTGRPWPVRNN